MILYGSEAKNQIEREIRDCLEILAPSGEKIVLHTFRTGEDPSQIAYENQIKKRCASLGITVASDVIDSETDMIRALDLAGEDPLTDGVLLFQPLPKDWNTIDVVSHIAAAKDVDGALGEMSAFVPCTAEACIRLIRAYGIDPKGKQCVVVGRSATVGKPLRKELERLGAFVTVCHSKTVDLAEETRKAELLFVACGKPKLIGANCVSEGQIVIDVGFHSTENGICGDVDTEAVAKIVQDYSPVPKGVGTVTMPTLLLHTVKSHLRRTKHETACARY